MNIHFKIIGLLSLLALIFLFWDRFNPSLLITVVLILVFIGLNIFRHQKEKKVTDIILQLEKKLEIVDTYLENGKGIMEISRQLKADENIPEIFTIKRILDIMRAASVKEVLPYTNPDELLAPSDVGVIKLLDQLISDFDTNKYNNALSVIKDLEDSSNVFFVKENVNYEETLIDTNEKKHGRGLFIMTLSDIIFIPDDGSFFKRVDSKKLLDMLDKLTEKMPILNLGLLSVQLLKDFDEVDKSYQPYFNDETKQKLETDFTANKGWYLPYSLITRFIYPFRMKGLKGVEHTLTIETAYQKIKLFHISENEDFKIQLMEQLILSNLLNRQIFYPKEGKHEVFFEKCKLVPHTEITYNEN